MGAHFLVLSVGLAPPVLDIHTGVSQGLKDMKQVALQFFLIKEVGPDYIVLEDDTTNVTVTFTDSSEGVNELTPPRTKAEHAKFFKHKQSRVGLEIPVRAFDKPRSIEIFWDQDDKFGLPRALPFEFPVSRLDVYSKQDKT